MTYVFSSVLSTLQAPPTCSLTQSSEAGNTTIYREGKEITQGSNSLILCVNLTGLKDAQVAIISWCACEDVFGRA